MEEIKAKFQEFPDIETAGTAAKQALMKLNDAFSNAGANGTMECSSMKSERIIGRFLIIENT